MMTNYHEPVLLAETIRFLNLSPGKVIVDGTVGGGGHSEAILSEIQPGGCLIGLDADQEALETAQKRLAPYGESAVLVHANFSSLKTVLAKLDIDHIDGILLDLGVSSHQLDIPERGFSFRQDAPLDMRMDLSAPQTAADLVNTLSVEDLTKIFFELGEERWARRIAEFIAQTRKTKPIVTTTELADLVRKAIPKAAWHRKSIRLPVLSRPFESRSIVSSKFLKKF
jgi:16S rRNA (cytosine1402-N4)-methyltransferase